MDEIIRGYKAFEKGMRCRGKQYKENTVFEEETAKICESGMHFCKMPFDVLDYYGYVNTNGEIPEINEFSEVEALDKVLTDDNKKYCTKKLKIGAKINIAGFVKAQVDFILSKINKAEAATNAGNYSAATNTGDRSAATVEGKESIAIATGIKSKAKGSLGCWIVLVEWEDDHIKTVKSHKVDGEIIKSNTFYTLTNGDFKEVEE